jgi:hypothetical protein
MGLSFTKRLREPIMNGEITVSVRVWHSPRVKAGSQSRLGEGTVEVTAIRQIDWSDITPSLARESGFLGVVDLLKIAKHGSGQKVYLVEFEYRAD